MGNFVMNKMEVNLSSSVGMKHRVCCEVIRS